ncbi:MAG: class II fructose-1,6-bisphosphate aldolase [bacterium]
MALIGTKEMFAKANREGYAVGAFNVNDMEILQGIVDAAKEEKAPLILQVSAGARKYARQGYLIHLVKAAMEDSGLDICLHLDHGEDFEICKSCVDGGFSSVMIDASALSYEDNIKETRRVVEYAHAKGVSVEAELGKLAGIEDAVNVSAEDAKFTNPEQAADFIKRSGCDSLAIAIGTSHGAYKFKGEARLDFARLEKIMSLITAGYPLVLHGASSVPQALVDKCNQYGGQMPNAKGVPEDLLRKAAALGVAKINIDSDLRLAMTATIREVFTKNPGEFDPRKYLGPARDAIKAVVQNKIKNVLGCSGKA